MGLQRGGPAGAWIVSCVGIAMVAAFVALYAVDRSGYMHAMTALMLRPTSHPFWDWEWVPSAAKCWSQGVDVYVNNTCYEPIANGRHSYSPLWLRLTFLPMDPPWIGRFGVVFAVSFYASLAALPVRRHPRDVTVMVLAGCSSFVAFALERGNIDILMFVGTVGGVWCWVGGFGRRLAGYAVFALLALLKFYPVVLLALLVREKRSALGAMAIALMAVFGLFVWRYGDELQAATANTPHGSWFNESFGAKNFLLGQIVLAARLAEALGWHDEASRQLYAVLVFGPLAIVLFLTALFVALAFAKSPSMQNAVMELSRAEHAFLLSGGLVVVGCFYAGQNVDYRGIFLLLPLPGLLKISGSAAGRRLRGLFTATWVAILFVMFTQTVQYLIVSLGLGAEYASDSSATGVVHWLLREGAWWLIVVVLSSVILRFVFDAPVWQSLRRSRVPVAVSSGAG